jgi:hypothetical protein
MATQKRFTYTVNESHFKMSGSPHSRYLKLVIAGAIQNRFPEPNINKPKTMKSIPDRNAAW